MRGGDLRSVYPAETASYKDYVIMWGKDLGRSIDYRETRPDVDAARLAYYGLSGLRLNPGILAGILRFLAIAAGAP